MTDLLQSDVWFFLILAAVLAAILVHCQSDEKAEKSAAFFTVLGDAMVLLLLCRRESPCECVEPC